MELDEYEQGLVDLKCRGRKDAGFAEDIIKRVVGLFEEAQQVDPAVVKSLDRPELVRRLVGYTYQSTLYASLYQDLDARAPPSED